MTSKDKTSGRVGYKRPPVHTQFKKGQSGNPAGRPRGKGNFYDFLDEALYESISVRSDGSSKRMIALEVTINQFVKRAAAGERRALKQLATLLAQQETAAPSPEILDVYMDEIDMAL